ncbi:MAG: phosphatidylglycerophosphatase A [bacterium]|nr:phosphatidylglycerophosphatase A [bacterium]
MRIIKRPNQIAPLSGPLDYIAAAIASCGVGFIPVSSGTFASLVATAAWISLSQLSWITQLEIILLVTILGTWASHRMERCWGHDPSQVVIDEVAGQWIALLTVPTNPIYFAVGFLLFRIFDILKPPPIRQAERQPGGIGIMLDDIIAGFAVLLALLPFQLLGVISHSKFLAW